MDSLRNFLGLPLDQPVEVIFEDRGKNAAPTNEGDGQPEPVGGAFLPRLDRGEDDPPTDEAALITQAIARRPDLQQLALGIRQTELLVQQAEAEARPGVMLVGSYSKSGEAATISESFRSLVNPSWGVGVTTSLSLTRSEDRAAIQQARGHLRLAQVNQRLRQDDVRLEVRRLVREVQAAADNVAVLDGTVKLAEENLRIRQTQLDHGLILPVDVMRTERQLSDTRSQHLTAVIAYELARARLSLAVGEMPLGVDADKRR
jgi:outer membrane protein TolC